MPSVLLVKPELQTQIFVESQKALSTQSVGDEPDRRRLLATIDADVVAVAVVVAVVVVVAAAAAGVVTVADVVSAAGVVVGPLVVVVIGIQEGSPASKLIKKCILQCLYIEKL